MAEPLNLVSNFTTTPDAICGIDCVGTNNDLWLRRLFSPAYIIKSVDSGATWQINMSAYAKCFGGSFIY
jgi:hypothetical protein